MDINNNNREQQDEEPEVLIIGGTHNNDPYPDEVYLSNWDQQMRNFASFKQQNYEQFRKLKNDLARSKQKEIQSKKYAQNVEGERNTLRDNLFERNQEFQRLVQRNKDQKNQIQILKKTEADLNSDLDAKNDKIKYQSIQVITLTDKLSATEKERDHFQRVGQKMKQKVDEFNRMFQQDHPLNNFFGSTPEPALTAEFNYSEPLTTTNTSAWTSTSPLTPSSTVTSANGVTQDNPLKRKRTVPPPPQISNRNITGNDNNEDGNNFGAVTNTTQKRSARAKRSFRN